MGCSGSKYASLAGPQCHTAHHWSYPSLCISAATPDLQTVLEESFVELHAHWLAAVLEVNPGPADSIQCGTDVDQHALTQLLRKAHIHSANISGRDAVFGLLQGVSCAEVVIERMEIAGWDAAACPPGLALYFIRAKARGVWQWSQRSSAALLQAGISRGVICAKGPRPVLSPGAADALVFATLPITVCSLCDVGRIRTAIKLHDSSRRSHRRGL